MTRDSKHWGYKLISFFTDVTIETAMSEISGKLQVRLVDGRTVLDSHNANYSFGSLHRLFRKVFRIIKMASAPPANLLLLGLGGGSVVSILRDEYRLDIPITAVDADPEVIRIAHDRFGIGKFRGLEIVCSDASEFLNRSAGRYGMIIVDLFVDNTVPEKFTGFPFIQACGDKLETGGVMVFNFILQNSEQHDQYAALLKNISTAGLSCTETRIFATNRVLFMRHS